MGNSNSGAAGASSGATTSSSGSGRFAFPDCYTSLPALQADLRRAGLESSNLIVGIDGTASNSWTGTRSFGGRNLHTIAPGANNFYEQAVQILGATLSSLDEDGEIPAYIYGCAGANDKGLMTLRPGDRPCTGFDGVLAAYRAAIPHVKLAGPTTFGPLIRKAIEIVSASENSYHVLIIVCDGCITRPSDLPDCEWATACARRLRCI